MTVPRRSPLRIEYRPGTNKRKYKHGRHQLLAWLKVRRHDGVASWEAPLSNVSQYAGDLVRDGLQVMRVDERPPGGSQGKGCRYFHPDYAPQGAVPVKKSAERKPLRVVEPEPAPAAPRRRGPSPSDFAGDLFELAEPTTVSYSDRKAA